MSKSIQWSMRCPPEGDASGQTVAASTTSAATTNAVNGDTAVVYSTVECFVVYGTTPTATVAAGMPIPANTLVRLYNIPPAKKLAFITATGTGNVYVRPST